MSAALRSQLVAAHRAFATLAPLMVELSAAETHGNTDRIGNAAYDAMAAADALAAALSSAFAKAADGVEFAVDHGAAQPFEAA